MTAGGEGASGLNFSAHGAPANATDALRAALDAARSAGGGTVALAPGKYFVRGSLAVPANTRLVGEAGAERTSVYFFEDGLADAPRLPRAAVRDVRGRLRVG